MDRSARAAFTSAYLGWVFDYYEVFLLTFLIIPITKSFGLSTMQSGWLFSAQLLSLAIGGVVFGWLADRYGRKPILVATIVIYALATFARAFAPDYAVMIVLTIIGGLGIGGEYGVGQSLVSELVPTRARGFWSGLLYGGAFVGIMLAALVGGYVAPEIGWRRTFAVSGLPVLFALYVRATSPESHIWEQLPRGTEATRLAIQATMSATFMVPFFKCLIIATIYFFAYYGIATFLPSYLVSQGLTITKASWWLFFSGFAGLVGNMLGSVLLDRVGRRWTMSILMIIATTAALALATIWATLLQSYLILIPFFVLFVGANGATVFGALFSEAFPTALRTAGISSSLQIARGLAFIPPLVVPLVLKNYGYEPIVFVSAAEFMFVGLWVWTFRETKNMDLASIDATAKAAPVFSERPSSLPA
jgi:MFS family permease